MEARDANGNRLYFGHFGIRAAGGRYGNMANFKNSYEDYSHLAVEGTVRSVEVDLDVTHTYNGDLEITLHKGDASGPVYMSSGPGNDVQLTDHEVGGFSGVDAAGGWELRVVDTMAQDVGQLESWSLHLEVQ